MCFGSENHLIWETGNRVLCCREYSWLSLINGTQARQRDKPLGPQIPGPGSQITEKLFEAPLLLLLDFLLHFLILPLCSVFACTPPFPFPPRQQSSSHTCSKYQHVLRALSALCTGFRKNNRVWGVGEVSSCQDDSEDTTLPFKELVIQ